MQTEVNDDIDSALIRIVNIVLTVLENLNKRENLLSGNLSVNRANKNFSESSLK